MIIFVHFIYHILNQRNQDSEHLYLCNCRYREENKHTLILIQNTSLPIQLYENAWGGAVGEHYMVKK